LRPFVCLRYAPPEEPQHSFYIPTLALELVLHRGGFAVGKMKISKTLPISLGALALASSIALLTFNIIFAINISQSQMPNVRTTAFVAFGLGVGTTALVFVLAGLASVFDISLAAASVVVLAMMKSKPGLPEKIVGSPTPTLITGAFIVWAISLLLHGMFLVCMVVVQKIDFRQQIQPYEVQSEPNNSSEMQESPRSGKHSILESHGDTSMESRTPTSFSMRSRSGSETVSSFRSSFTHVVRPITSKTRLISSNQKSLYRPASVESMQRETIVTIEDGFDSWDTSAVDSQSRQTVESASPIPPRFLETIPASPTGSRSPSPGFPLDLEPPKTRQRSRSYSPATSVTDIHRPTRSPSGESLEAHIHPLFRSDSPTPPPAITPGTIVTAAPGAGSVISDRNSIRSISRMRSESLPSSPLMHSNSLESIKRTMEREDREREELGAERTLTPPIPEWILAGAASRNSLTSYTRKKSQMGKMGEPGEG